MKFCTVALGGTAQNSQLSDRGAMVSLSSLQIWGLQRPLISKLGQFSGAIQGATALSGIYLILCNVALPPKPGLGRGSLEGNLMAIFCSVYAEGILSQPNTELLGLLYPILAL